MKIVFLILTVLYLSFNSYSQVLPSYYAVHHKKSNSGSSSDNPAESCKEITNFSNEIKEVVWLTNDAYPRPKPR